MGVYDHKIKSSHADEINPVGQVTLHIKIKDTTHEYPEIGLRRRVSGQKRRLICQLCSVGSRGESIQGPQYIVKVRNS